tara:strand:- start:270 stop:605 length:336 start_codon:yes stop_codon:yes gene_type:complete
MGLGNNTSIGQIRGKNKPVVIKRIKEVVRAKDFNSISGSPVQGSSACSYSGALNVTYYTSSTVRVNGVLYTSKRARKPNKFTAGHIKYFDGRSNANITVNELGVITALTRC